ncbi:MAG TPA: TlpA disulfide reductase family protein [Thermoanaerobaculia bacterium]|nr:TlpA disulfide reductase family protein [Thermoanaerobaculia bacterium]
MRTLIVALSTLLAATATHARTAADVFADARAALERSGAITFDFDAGDLRGSGVVVPQRGANAARLLVRANALQVWSDGASIDVLDAKTKTLWRSAPHRGGRLLLARHLHGVGDAFAAPDFFEETLMYGPKLAATANVAGVECEVVTVAYPGGEWRWYFDRANHLLRRQVVTSEKKKETIDYTNVGIVAARTTPARPSTRGYAVKEFQAGRVQIGGDPGEWSVRTLSGEVVSNRSLRGHVTIVDFWASWCGPCRPAMQALQTFQRAHRDDARVIGLRWRDGGDLAAFAAKQNLDYALADAGAAANVFSVDQYGLPVMFILGRDGRVVDYAIGYDGAITEAWLAQTVAAALRE